MLAARTLKHKALYSPLATSSSLKPRHGRGKKSVVTTVLLTSLVDAFSILVIFLIINSGTPQDTVKIGENMTLPDATQGRLLEKAPIIRVENGRYFINDIETKESKLTQALFKIRQTSGDQTNSPESLMILADKELDYIALNPIIVKASQAGFNEFKFAVLKKESAL